MKFRLKSALWIPGRHRSKRAERRMMHERLPDTVKVVTRADER
jgi:hypothetical protein